MRINLIATVKLLDAVEPILRPGSAAVLIASSAGHLMGEIPEATALLSNPLAPDFLPKINALMDAMAQGNTAVAGGISYSLTKQAVLKLVQSRAVTWGPLGARITSISPGMILTPMGRTEVQTKGGEMMQNAAPLGRPGQAADIALAVQFLASDQASFISGTDLLIDGGSVAAIKLGAVPFVRLPGG
jgi:NAD(P)-dependent dehydrogenase (short-subunit alcohol dehydrogenase family)